AVTGVTLAAAQHVVVDSGTVTTLTNLPAIPANWLTASGINAGALNGKGAWLPASGYTVAPTAAAVATAVWQDLTASADFTTAGSSGALLVANLNATVASRSTFAGLGAAAPAGWINTAAFAPGATLPHVTLVDTLTTYSGNTPQTGDLFAVVNPMVVSHVFTAPAMANAPSGTGASASTIAAAVWQDVVASADFTTGGSIGALLKTYAAPPAASAVAAAVLTDTTDTGTA